MTLARPQIDTTSYSNKDNKYIKEGDSIEYILELKNSGKVVANNLEISNSIPKDFKVVSVECTKDDGYTFSGLAVQNVNMNLELLAGQSAKVVLKCIAENIDTNVQEKATSNSWNVSGTNVGNITTKNYDNIIQKNPDESRISTTVNRSVSSNATENNVDSTVPDVFVSSAVTNDNQVVDNTNTYRIIGKAFYDKNKNGQRDDDEEGMDDVVAQLFDASSQEIVAQTVTNKIGEYVFEDVSVGEYYVKFEYDNTKYSVTDYKKQGVTADRNSDAIVSNYKAVTDKIKVTDTSISDIDIGLVRAGIFDLSLDANLNKITVQNDEGTNTYEMENPKLAKIDINPKYVNSSKIFAEYTISVTNRGEIAGYVKSIVDYLPEGLELDTSMNSGWYVGSDGNAYTNQLEDILIQPGETKEVKLILTKQMTENGNGIFNNAFEIAETYNEYAIEDIDSTPGNQAQDEDDMSKADLIIGIQTGGSMINLMIISTTLITVLIALYVIKIQIDKKNKEVMI